MDTHVFSATSADAQAEDWRHSHRPRKFTDIIGHHEAVRKLLALVAAGRVFHVVLSGPSGVGKTTLARLLAQLLICQARGALEACGVCHSCRSIQAAGSHSTYHEINTPGRMGSKDELEKFITGRLRFPMPGYPYHVVFLDEAGLLSIYAANLLLKQMEDAHSAVCFIFALVDDAALPEPLKQRCVSIKLEALTVAQKVAGLERIAAAEVLSVEPGALVLIAQQSVSLRTATGALQQVHELLGRGEIITVAALKSTLYAASSVAVIEFLAAALNGDLAGVLTASDRMDTDARNRFRDIQRLLFHIKTTLVGPYLVPVSEADALLYAADDTAPLLAALKCNAAALEHPLSDYVNELLEYFAFTPPPSPETFAIHATLFVELCLQLTGSSEQATAAQLAALPAFDEPCRSIRRRRPKVVRRGLTGGGRK